MSKMEDIVNAVKLNELLHKKEEPKKCNKWVCILTIVGAITAVVGIAYAMYKFLSPKKDECEEDFDDDFFDDEDEDECNCGCGCEDDKCNCDDSCECDCEEDCNCGCEEDKQECETEE